MIEWYKKVVFENYANFSGRARRSEYWYFRLVNFLIMFLLLSLFGIFAAMDKVSIGFIFYGIVMLLALATIIPSLAVGVRRMHDVGKSGWYLLVPVYNLILTFTEGEAGVNQYGEDPKQPNSEFNQIGNE